MIESDEEDIREEVSQIKKEEAFSELTVEEGVNILKQEGTFRREDSLRREQREQEEQGSSEE